MIPTPPSPVPSRSLPQDIFDGAIAAFFAYITTFVSAANELLGNVQDKSDNADAQAAAAAASAASALVSEASAEASATDAASYAGSPAWSAGNYLVRDLVYSPDDQRIYRRLTNGASAIDPGFNRDPANWRLASEQLDLATNLSILNYFYS